MDKIRYYPGGLRKATDHLVQISSVRTETLTGKVPNRQELYPYLGNQHLLQNGDNDSDKTENCEISACCKGTISNTS